MVHDLPTLGRLQLLSTKPDSLKNLLEKLILLGIICVQASFSLATRMRQGSGAEGATPFVDLLTLPERVMNCPGQMTRLEAS